MEKERNRISLPDCVLIDEKEASPEAEGIYSLSDCKIELQSEGDGLLAFLEAGETSVKKVTLIWKDAMDASGEILGDTWERAYGEQCFKKRGATDIIPWYFVDDRGKSVYGFGVQVQCGAMCYWTIKENDLLLHLDVRNGSEGVLLQGRRLFMAKALMWEYEAADAFSAACAFCKRMCPDPLTTEAPLYGSNNWYYAYGKSSAKEILGDAAYLAKLTKGNENRPFMVIDDGWQTKHTADYNGGPWDSGNGDYGDMSELAAGIRHYDVRPGIWFRPLLDTSKNIPAEWRLERDEKILDISVPEVVSHVKEDITRIREWGFELIKHDFSTFDIFGIWGFEMGADITKTKWAFHDRTRTSAEIIVDFYRAIREAAGSCIILGCNCIGHLGAGLMEANRTGDDTSGVEWERTRKMGVNTLAFRMPQQGTFYGADADCVGITDKIPWEKNSQWLKILSFSGTPFFVSVKPKTLSRDREQEVVDAYRRASENRTMAIPLDWKEGKLPARWQTFEGVFEFQW